jgi:serine/threonine protein kinase
LKLEFQSDNPGSLAKEIKIYKNLEGGEGIPKVLWQGFDGDYHIAALELLGPSLKDLVAYCGSKFSEKTVFLLAIDLIDRLHYIHQKGFVHRDISPGNVMMGMGSKVNRVYLADFGTAQYLTEHRTPSWYVGGTVYYASITLHNRKRESISFPKSEST